jgi:hypothetical protein
LQEDNKVPKSNSNIYWHAGFYGGIELEFKAYKRVLTFDIEYELSKEPLRIDMLIIKKNSVIEISNQIGIIFKEYNIFEYKSPEDGLSIDDYVKTVAYACLYKGLGKNVDAIPLDELTVSICRNAYPRDLIKNIENYGGTVERKYPGIYYVSGIISIPSQIIVTSELEGKEHAVLRILSKNAREEDVIQFIEETDENSTPGDINNANAVLQVSSKANRALYDRIRRNKEMCQALMEIMSEEVKEREDAAVEANQRESVLNLMEALNYTAEQAMDVLKIPQEKRERLISGI